MIDRVFLRRLLRTATFVSGLALAVVGAGPLIGAYVLDRLGLVNVGNGLGLGLLFTFTFWPGAALMVIGVALAAREPPQGS